jgi:hypothetical protein
MGKTMERIKRGKRSWGMGIDKGKEPGKKRKEEEEQGLGDGYGKREREENDNDGRGIRVRRRDIILMDSWVKSEKKG